MIGDHSVEELWGRVGGRTRNKVERTIGEKRLRVANGVNFLFGSLERSYQVL